MATATSWERPSPAVADLIRVGAELLLQTPDALFAEIDAVTLAHVDGALLADPTLVAGVRRTNRANLRYWAEANLREPGVRVPPNLSPDVLGVARDLVRRGFDSLSLDAYRTGQNVAWQLWMQAAFSLTSDPDELRELLEVSARSIFAFVDETIAGIAEQVERERDRLTRGTNAERLEVVTLLLEGAPIRPDRAAARLNWALDRTHTAAIAFVDGPSADPGALQRAAEALARAAGARRPFTVVASASSLWVWVSGADPAAGALDLAGLEAELTDIPEVRLALGPAADGIEGFRRSHLDALATQRLLHRTPDAVRLATYDDVQVVALATVDEDRAREFAERTLGSLATAAPELRETLHVYLREQSSPTRAARALETHRNTILNRLARAEQLLPAPLEGRGLQVGLALEVVRWLGTR